MTNTQEAITYVTYSEYKNFNDVDVLWPFEISEDIANYIIDFVKRNMDKYEINSDFCKRLRMDLDDKFGKYWNVFAGKNFGSYAVHDKYAFIYFKYRTYSFLIYKISA